MPPKILVVDDELDTLELLDRTFQFAGYDVTKAKNGKEALALMLENRPDAVILDVMMPGQSGFEVLAVINQMFGNPPPVIFFSIRDDVSEITRGLKAGAHSYLVKPASIEKLLEAVRSALASRS
jgi:two-component system response regulator MprA